MAGTRMLHSDAFAWYMEKDPVLRSTIVAVNRLESAPDWESLHHRIDRLTRLVPSLRMRVQAPPLRIGPPRWSVDENFDLAYHLRRSGLGAGAGWDDVLEFARTAAMADFDRSRPLWEFTLLEGLAGGEAAFVTKLHHSLTDGIGGMQLAALVVDLAPDAHPDESLPPAPIGHSSSVLGLTARSIADDLVEFAGATARIARAVPGETVSAVRHPLTAAKTVFATTASVGRFVTPVSNQLSSELGERRTGRHLAVLDVPVDRLLAASRAAGGHLNDAFLAALTDGMHRYHERRGVPLDEVRVTMPVSLRSGTDPLGGNRITLTRIRMPAAIAEPADRIKHISRLVSQWRHEPALGHAQEIAFGLNLLPRAYLGGMFKRVELLASDVPGIPQPVWLAGARVIGYYAFGPTIGSGMNATLMSYAGTCNIGVNVDTGAVDDPEALIDCLREAFEDVLALAAPSAAAPAPT
ncbi:MAG TPA: wax ester/triacylglycerol synthase domain-containing protein [Jatrophihabitans sp.]|jgi:WS/DGAT/MGAT family acyltransferase|uniref:wax ester/triacylglycerol synthase domain-containing protein n=1 Tax=Jatrophihabitans sp. TaxID=1932789 RepID=UPI002E000B96|nr:wax ester/triacylglycerol synthase domain-containing protein [Jatrophihabitans sp.]